MKATQTDLRLGRTWLKQMGRGAERNGITIQYCMAPSRCALQSLEIPVVSQVTPLSITLSFATTVPRIAEIRMVTL